MRLYEVIEPTVVFYHVTLSDNVNSIMQHGLRPSTGDRSAKLDDTGIFLFNDRDTMEDALGGWLGDEFDEDEELTVLIVTVPKDFPISQGEAGFEWISHKPIPPKYIKVGWTE